MCGDAERVAELWCIGILTAKGAGSGTSELCSCRCPPWDAPPAGKLAGGPRLGHTPNPRHATVYANSQVKLQNCTALQPGSSRAGTAMRTAEGGCANYKAMKLADFLFQTGMTTTQLRRALGVASRSTITRYLHGERVPTNLVLQKIIELTGGRVQLRDFLTPGNPECATVIVLPGGMKKLVFPWSTRESDLVAANTVEIARAVEQDNFSDPSRKAITALGGRARRLTNGSWMLDGRPSELRRIVLEANRQLKEQRRPLIDYPGLTEQR